MFLAQVKIFYGKCLIKNCFSINSPFGYLIKKGAKHFFINLDYKEAMTFVHVAEQVEKVKYRYEKIFHGNYINKFKKLTKNIKNVC